MSSIVSTFPPDDLTTGYLNFLLIFFALVIPFKQKNETGIAGEEMQRDRAHQTFDVSSMTFVLLLHVLSFFLRGSRAQASLQHLSQFIKERTVCVAFVKGEVHQLPPFHTLSLDPGPVGT
jgi:hypothetical protein